MCARSFAGRDRTQATRNEGPVFCLASQQLGTRDPSQIFGRSEKVPLIIRLTDDIYRGRRPTRELLLAAEPNPRTLLNLESGWYERLNPGVLKAHELASELGMVQLRLPMSPLKPPSLAQVVEAYEMMNSLDVPRPLLVHCREGVDRTGVVCAYYRVVAEGWSPADAMQEMLSLGFHRWRYLYWLPQIRRLLQRAQNGDRR